MPMNSTMKNRARFLLPRGRAAVVTGGMVAALALGSTTAALAGGGTQHEAFLAAGNTRTVAQSIHQQAATQHAATQQHAAAHKAHRASWVTPTTGYVLGARFMQAGPHWAHKHSGQDFVVPSGTKVRAAHSGVVVEADWGGAYGNNIVLRHGRHLYTQYGHLSHIGVHVGQHVATGQQIGRSGDTGNTTGPHLHFEVRTTPFYGSGVEPLHFLKEHGVNP